MSRVCFVCALRVLMVAASCLALTALPSSAAAANETSGVRLMRLPPGGIQPQVAVGDDGTVHLIYFAGQPQNGNLYYVRLRENTDQIGPGERVNHHPDSAVAIGNIRGAHLALGRNDRVHIAWMGSAKAEPKAPGGAAPMLYTRSDGSGGFEAERNVIASHVGLDGGGSVAADQNGNVYVVWHAPEEGKRGEENRRVWVAASRDDGATFEREVAASPSGLGCCGCCGIRAATDADGRLLVFFRSAQDTVHRDMHLLVSRDVSRTFLDATVDFWNVGACVMSTAAVRPTKAATLVAWETQGQVYFGEADPQTGAVAGRIAAPGGTRQRKHPTVAANERGQTLLVWTEGMGWNQGGKVAWQLYNADGQPVRGQSGEADGVPVWGLVAAFADAAGRLTIIY